MLCLNDVQKQKTTLTGETLRSIVRPSAHSGGKSWQKVGTCNFEVSRLPAAFQIPYTVRDLRYLYKISAKITYLTLLI